MPVAQQRAEREYIALPASTSSFDFFSESLANCVRLGLLMSATLNVGCRPVLLGTKGWAGSNVTGGGLPGMAIHWPPIETHPTLFEEKSGGLAFPLAASCARAGESDAPTQR